jgi:hypothetical protein
MPELSGTYHIQNPPPNIRKKHLAGILARSPGIFRKMNQETQAMETLKTASEPTSFSNICPAAIVRLFRSSPCIRIQKWRITLFAAARINRIKSKISSPG